MLRSRSWFGGLLGKPKNLHSLEHLKYLYNVLSKNQVVSDSNRSLLVETLRSIAEILIWGDQNDSTVFDFFLEKNMLSFFLSIMKQKCGSYVCVQLLQTLNILFENIRNETSLYYLLSNNLVNSIIVHKFDFSDEEVMAYYISFLKTLSLKLNSHTVHFFYNEHTNDFPLYTEAIKFFNHPESMVRIAVRTLTLNVYRVDDSSMLRFIRDKTAAPYFSNLVWFIGKHVAELDTCVRGDSDHQCQNRLADLVAEHLDHLHYLNDILQLEIADLNEVLTDHLINKLFLPLYIGSLSTAHSLKDKKSNVSKVVSLFLLSQVFLIISHEPLVQLLAGLLLGEGGAYACNRESPSVNMYHSCQEASSSSEVLPRALPPDDSPGITSCDHSLVDGVSSLNVECSGSPLNASISDEEKSKMLGLSRGEELEYTRSTPDIEPSVHSPRHRRLSTKPCLHSILHCLESVENDYSALFALCLLYAIGHNQGVGKERLKGILSPADSANDYNVAFIEKIVRILCQGCTGDQQIRLVTVELALILLRDLSNVGGSCVLKDCHLAALAGGKEESTSVLRNYYKSDELFLDLFEDEYNEMTRKPLNVEFLMMDAAVLLPPTTTPMTGIEFSKRLPCGENERTRRAIRVFFLLRDLCLTLGIEQEMQTLPLTNPNAFVRVDNVLDLNNSDLIACTVVMKDGTKIRRFLVIDVLQVILVEPDTKRLGWGVAKLVGSLQDLEISGDKDDNRSLHLTIYRPLTSSTPNRIPILSAKFIYDDHIRCMAAKQRLTKGRIKARQKKMHLIAKLLDLPSNLQPSPSPLYPRSRPGSAGKPGRDHRSIQPSTQRLPAGVILRRDSAPEHSESSEGERKERSKSGVACRSRERSLSRRHPTDYSSPRRAASGSPRMPRPRSEEIPLEDIRNKVKRENILLLGAQQSKFQAPPLAVPSTSHTTPVMAVELPVQPEETSFTEESNAGSEKSSGERKQRRKGQVETV